MTTVPEYGQIDDLRGFKPYSLDIKKFSGGAPFALALDLLAQG